MKWGKIQRMSGITEWICECGVGHPDLAHIDNLVKVARINGVGKKGIDNITALSVHGCCGCCGGDDFPGRAYD